MTEGPKRPSVAAETRAWITVAVMLFVNITGGVWWAATLSAEVKNIRELLTDTKKTLETTYREAEARKEKEMSTIQSQLQDQENRLRMLEATRAAAMVAAPTARR